MLANKRWFIVLCHVIKNMCTTGNVALIKVLLFNNFQHLAVSMAAVIS